jgi:hypothetical protein
MAISPAPADVTDASSSAPPPAPIPPTTSPSSKLPADPLSDGTTPTVLAAGDGHRSVKKSRASLTAVYRRADILTTLYTFVGIVIALSVVGGAYFFFTRTKTATSTPTKVTQLSQSDLDKLGAFFGGNSAGSASQVLTISSSSLFNNRVAIASDLKVVGAAQISGATSLTDLSVEKTSTLGITNVRGSLSVTGPLNVQSPTILGNGASINGNLSVTGNGSFGGSLSGNALSVATLTVSGNLNLAGHLSIAGSTPQAAPGSEAGAGGSVTVEGNDASGAVNVNTGNIPGHVGNQGGLLAVITFHTAYPRAPHVVISATGQNGASVLPYVLKTATGFTIGTVNDTGSNKTYTFDYWVAQ